MKQHDSIKELQQDYFLARENNPLVQKQADYVIKQLRKVAKTGNRTVVFDPTIEKDTLKYLRETGFEVASDIPNRCYHISFPV
jgi:hypothetical protein